jgi:hypothetical protein
LLTWGRTDACGLREGDKRQAPVDGQQGMNRQGMGQLLKTPPPPSELSGFSVELFFLFRGCDRRLQRHAARIFSKADTALLGGRKGEKPSLLANKSEG